MVYFDNNMCPAHIHGFFQIKSSRVPTKMLVDDKDKPIEEIYGNNIHASKRVHEF